jgi:ligand-binding sensor domain-containing protein
MVMLNIFLIAIDVQAQYVRGERFNTERERRQYYAIDDWISYKVSNRVNTASVGNNYIYFATRDGGILRYELFQNYWDYPYTTSNGLPSNKVLDVAFEFSTGYLWAVTDMDTCIFKPAEQEWLCKSEAPFWSYTFPDREQPTYSDQIKYNVFYPSRFLDLLPNYFANGSWTVIDGWKLMDEHFDEFPVTGFLLDNWERVWFMIDGLGFGIGNTYSQRIDVIPYGLTFISPRVLHYESNDIWIGGESLEEFGRPGIVRWQQEEGTWSYYRARWISNLPSDNVIDIVTSGDSVWFATDYGLSLFHQGKESWKNFDQGIGLYSKELLDLLVHQNVLYVASDRGINTIDLPSGVIRRVKDQNINLATVYQLAAQGDTIWAATNRGIFRMRFPDKGWEPVITTGAISDMPVLAVETFNNEVWFTSPEGVFWLDGVNDHWQSFPQLGMEISGPFYDLEINDRSVWVSTPEGLLKFNRSMQYWKLFTTEDGLLDNICFQLFLDGDYIWITTASGITQFYWNNPERID